MEKEKDDPPEFYSLISRAKLAVQRKIAIEARSSFGGLHEETVLDIELARFLRFHKYQVQKAVRAYLLHLNALREKKLDNVRALGKPIVSGKAGIGHSQDFADLLHHFLPENYHGFDKAGRPIYILKIGQARLTDMLERLTLQDILEYHMHEMEYIVKVLCPAGALRTGRHPVSLQSMCNIIDLTGVSMEILKARPFLQAITEFDNVHYPWMMGCTYVLHAPSFVNNMYKVVRPLLDEYTASRVQIFGGREEYESVLLANIDADQLPREYGGACKKCRQGSCLPQLPSLEALKKFDDAQFQKVLFVV